MLHTEYHQSIADICFMLLVFLLSVNMGDSKQIVLNFSGNLLFVGILSRDKKFLICYC